MDLFLTDFRFIDLQGQTDNFDKQTSNGTNFFKSQLRQTNQSTHD